MREPEKYYITKQHPNDTADYAVTKEWSDWDKRQLRIAKLKRKILRIVFWWAIKPLKSLSKFEIRRIR